MSTNCKGLRKEGWQKIREDKNASLNLKLSIFAIIFKMFACLLLSLIVFFVFTLVKIDIIPLLQKDYTVKLMLINYACLSLLLLALVPLNVGVSNIFLKISRGQKVKYTDIFIGYKYFFKMFGLELLRFLFIFLWSLLLFVPGIIKSLSLSQAHTVFLDNPKMKIIDILKESQRLMFGKKKFYFCLALSFIGWEMLCFLTFGVLHFIIYPVMNIANSAFYNNLIDYNTQETQEMQQMQEIQQIQQTQVDTQQIQQMQVDTQQIQVENTEAIKEQKSKRVMNKTMVILSVIATIAIALSFVVCSLTRIDIIYMRPIRHNIFYYLSGNRLGYYQGDIILILIFSLALIVLNILSLLLKKNALYGIRIILSVIAIVFVWYFYCKLFFKQTGKFGEVLSGMVNLVNNKALQLSGDFLPVFVFFNLVNIATSFFQIDCAIKKTPILQ